MALTALFVVSKAAVIKCPRQASPAYIFTMFLGQVFAGENPWNLYRSHPCGGASSTKLPDLSVCGRETVKKSHSFGVQLWAHYLRNSPMIR